MKFAALLLRCGLIAGTANASAQTLLVNYSFTNQTSVTSVLTATSVATNLTASLFSVSDGSFTSTNFTTGGPLNSPAVADSGSWDAASATKYFSFTITPAAGYQVNITNISFDYRQTSAGAANFQIAIGSNNNAGSGTFTRDSAWHSVAPTITSTSSAGSTEIRIYGYGGGTGSFAIDQINITGTMSAVPEPSTYAAIAGAVSLVGAVMRRRRSRAAQATHQQKSPPLSAG